MNEEVSLTEPPGMDHIYAITAKLADKKSESFAVMHGTTFVWPFIATYPHDPCISKKIYSGTARLYL